MTRKFNVGDTVRYSSKWLRNVGIYSGPLPFARGEVLAINPKFGGPKGGGLLTLKWDNPEASEFVLGANLELVKSNKASG